LPTEHSEVDVVAHGLQLWSVTNSSNRSDFFADLSYILSKRDGPSNAVTSEMCIRLQ
jgi:hypothetical protein